MIETCSALFIKETLTIAAYEGSRVGIMRNGTNSLARQKIEEFLDSRGITYTSDSIEFSSPGFGNAQELQHVTTTVTVTCADNMYTGWIFGGGTLSAEVTMRKEYENP